MIDNVGILEHYFRYCSNYSILNSEGRFVYSMTLVVLYLLRSSWH